MRRRAPLTMEDGMRMIDLIKERFPNPTTINNSKEDYCVGGAFCLFRGSRDTFPGPIELAEELMSYNSNLDIDQALAYGNLITGYNDKGNFDRAWELLGEALVK